MHGRIEYLIERQAALIENMADDLSYGLDGLKTMDEHGRQKVIDRARKARGYLSDVIDELSVELAAEQVAASGVEGTVPEGG